MVKKRITREEKRKQRHANLKTAATQIFAEQGYHETKVSQIVERVGVAQGTFYLYYEGKKPLFGELVNEFLQLFVTTISQWKFANLETLDILEVELHRIGLQLANLFVNKKDLTKIFFREALGVDEVFDTNVREFYEYVYDSLAAFNENLWTQGLIEKMNFRLLAIQTVGMIERVIKEFVVNETLANTELDEIVDHLVLNFLSGTRKNIQLKTHPELQAAAPALLSPKSPDRTLRTTWK